jgi:hypothetical protein
VSSSGRKSKERQHVAISNADMTRVVKSWEPPRAAQLFADPDQFGLAKLRNLGFDKLRALDFSKAFAIGFADQAKTRPLLSSLRTVGVDKQSVLPTAMGASAALEAARPMAGSIDRKLLAGVAGQLAGLETALRYREPTLTKALDMSRIFATSWRRQFAGMGEALERLVEEQRRLDERTNEFVRRYGWPIPHSLPEVSYRQLAGLVGHPRQAVNHLMVEAFRPGTRLYRSARSVLTGSPHFEPRRPLLKQVWRAQRQGHWYLVVNALLPLVEGVLADVMFPKAPVRQRPKRADPSVRALAEVDPNVAGPLRAAETVLLSAGGGSALFDPYDPPHGVEPRALNRNAVLHGIARRYGTEQNATKLFLLLVLMAECFEFKDVVEAEKERKRERDRERRRQRRAAA